jgi:NADPH:quinone reductase-like Zn-dependent oxidoreductase
MKAAIFHRYGSTDVLEIADLPKPTIRDDEILVRVRAAAINPKDTFIRKGRFQRFTGNKFPKQTGFDFAGEIEAMGSDMGDLRVGDAVFGMFDGWQGSTCAEYVKAQRHELALMPKSASFEEAAALPLTSLTALQALRDDAKLQAGAKVCINGASGGVGTMAVQIAKILGDHVTALASENNHAFLRGLGADECLDYQQVDILKSEERFDAFFDVFGNTRFDKIKPILCENGIWISTVLQPHVFLSVSLSRFFSRKKAKLVVVKSRSEDFAQITNWMDSGKLKPIIHAVYPLEKIREAHAQQETKHSRGKIVIRI